MKVHRAALLLSIIFIAASLVLVFVRGLNLGIDFSGGVLIEARINSNFEISKVREVIDKEVKDVQIQNIDQHGLLIRIPKTENEQADLIKAQKILSANFEEVEYRKVDYVGPQVSADLMRDGLLALLMAFIFIMIYIWVRFDWQFGLGGIFALLHDVILTLGFLSLTQLEVNLTSIAAILTIVGYSINDSVVIYDRIRENLTKYRSADISNLINSSINSTLSRTVLTSSTIMISLLSFAIFGGETLKSFSVTTLFGILIGTYSSMYISAPVLIYFKLNRKSKPLN